MNIDIFAQLSLLVVDESHAMRELTRSMLRQIGIGSITGAASGHDALTALDDRPVDLILTAWAMAPMNGQTLIRLIRRLPDHRRAALPIIVLTDHADRLSVKTARDAGASAFLTRPVSAGQLIDRIAEAVRRPRPFIRTAGYIGPDRRRPSRAEPSASAAADAWQRLRDTVSLLGALHGALPGTLDTAFLHTLHGVADDLRRQAVGCDRVLIGELADSLCIALARIDPAASRFATTIGAHIAALHWTIARQVQGLGALEDRRVLVLLRSVVARLARATHGRSERRPEPPAAPFAGLGLPPS